MSPLAKAIRMQSAKDLKMVTMLNTMSGHACSVSLFLVIKHEKVEFGV